VQQRRQYSSATATMMVTTPSNETKEVYLDLEVEVGTSFRCLLALVQQGICDDPESKPDKSDITLAWDAKVSDLDHWLFKFDGPDHIQISSPCEEALHSFTKLFAIVANAPEDCVFKNPLFSQVAISMAKSWGTPDMNMKFVSRDTKPLSSSFTNQPWNLSPVPELLARCQYSAQADAIVGKEFTVTHEELRNRAAAIAVSVLRHKQNDCQSNTVAVFMGRGEMIIPAFLGVLQSGCQVVPLDVHWPADRIRSIASSSGFSLVLTDLSSESAWRAVEMSTPCLTVQPSLWQESANTAASRLDEILTSLDQDSPALMLFTSGSTGQPKGIVLPHAYFTTLIASVAIRKDVTNIARWVCYFSPSWMPFLDSFAALLMGGTVLMFPEGKDHVINVAELADFAAKNHATHATCVPATFDVLVEQGIPPTITHIGTGGGACPVELAKRGRKALPPQAKFTSGWSGTEFGAVTFYCISADEDIAKYTTEKGYLHAGWPNCAQQVAIVDEGFHLVGPGSIGEICVAGPGLATGYLHLPEKTAETWLPSFPALDGLRTARSGDLGTWTSSGNLQVVGRRDGMVKVRGARIEIGEVEAVVGKHAGVKSCVATVIDDRLVAYVVPAVPGDIREHCKGYLAAYMVPHLFEGIEELPKLPNGKINKKALPKPAEGGAEVVMELDSLGQMRKFTRLSAAEDRILDNVRAIIIAIVIQSHMTPLLNTSLDICAGEPNSPQPLGAQYLPFQYTILQVLRSGGWSSLAFLNGFDDTRSMNPYALNYRELFFFILWIVCDFNWTMWFLAAFVWMRIAFSAAHSMGMERLHMFVACQTWIVLPMFVDLYVGWQGYKLQDAPCPSGCFCPWQIPYAETIMHYVFGYQWWTSKSFLMQGLVFVPCYWLGFYCGRPVFGCFTRLADDSSFVRRAAVALVVLASFVLCYRIEPSINNNIHDHCEAFWIGNRFVWKQILNNLAGFALNLCMSLLVVMFIAATATFHLKHLAKICFSALLLSPFTPCALNLPGMVIAIREMLPAPVSYLAETALLIGVPLLYIHIVGSFAEKATLVAVRAGRHLQSLIKKR